MVCRAAPSGISYLTRTPCSAHNQILQSRGVCSYLSIPAVEIHCFRPGRGVTPCVSILSSFISLPPWLVIPLETEIVVAPGVVGRPAPPPPLYFTISTCWDTTHKGTYQTVRPRWPELWARCRAPRSPGVELPDRRNMKYRTLRSLTDVKISRAELPDRCNMKCRTLRSLTDVTISRAELPDRRNMKCRTPRSPQHEMQQATRVVGT